MEALRQTLTTLQQDYGIQIELVVMDRRNEIKLNGRAFNIKTANIFLRELIEARLEVQNALERLNYRRNKLCLPVVRLQIDKPNEK